MGRAVREIALFTEQVDALAAFYSRCLAADPVHRGRGIAIFEVGGLTVLIHEKGEAPAPGEPPNEDHHAVAVVDLDAACASLEADGLTILAGPKTYDWGRSAYLRDPDGRLVELHASSDGAGA